MKNRILLVFEDYAEMTKTQTYLKKVGFDVVALNNEALLSDRVLNLNPEVVIAFGKNNRVHNLIIAQKLSESIGFRGKTALIFLKEQMPQLSSLQKLKADAVVEAPIYPEKLLKVLSHLMALEIDPLLDKLYRFMSSEVGETLNVQGAGSDEANKINVHGGKSKEGSESANPHSAQQQGSSNHQQSNGNKKSPQILSDRARAEKYEDLVSGIYLKSEETTHSRKAVEESWNKLRKDWKKDDLEKQDQLKRNFAEALFKKNR